LPIQNNVWSCERLIPLAGLPFFQHPTTTRGLCRAEPNGLPLVLRGFTDFTAGFALANGNYGARTRYFRLVASAGYDTVFQHVPKNQCGLFFSSALGVGKPFAKEASGKPLLVILFLQALSGRSGRQ